VGNPDTARMTMHSHVSHSVSLALPLLLFAGFMIGIGAVGVYVVDPILMADQHALPLVATIGTGIDEFFERFGGIVRSVVPQDLGAWILAIAVCVTLWSVIKVIREFRGHSRGAGDAGALVRYTIQHTVAMLGIHPQSVCWGVVRDAATGDPLPLATVRLFGNDGAILSSCVSDRAGRYGFRFSRALFAERGYHAIIQSQKSGYYFPPADNSFYRGGSLCAISRHAQHLDIGMDRAGDTPVAVRSNRSYLWDWSESTAFWVGILVVPFAFLQQPDALRGLMFSVFIGAAGIRAMWHDPKHL
jgi:hypothetical protein